MDSFENELVLGSDRIEELAEELRRDRILADQITRGTRVIQRAVKNHAAESTRLARGTIESMLGGDIPIKHQIRAIENPTVRNFLGGALRAYRDEQLEEVLQNPALTWSTPLTAGDDFGPGMDERAVELSLALEALEPDRPGRSLDAGASLNVPSIQRVLRGSNVTIVHLTQSGEKEPARFDGGRVSYVFADLRALPFRDGWFDRVISVSTLEHVGLDNTRYGGPLEADPSTYSQAVDELARVTSPGGTLFLSVPVGSPRNLGWFQIFSPSAVDEIAESLQGFDVSVRYFTYSGVWVDSNSDEVEQVDSDMDIVKSIAVIRGAKRG